MAAKGTAQAQRLSYKNEVPPSRIQEPFGSSIFIWYFVPSRKNTRIWDLKTCYCNSRDPLGAFVLPLPF